MLSDYSYIAIEGAIGAGKTSFASKLASDLDAALMLESFEDNTFLPKFYEDAERYAFPVELSFLAQRYQQIKQGNIGNDLFRQLTVSDYFLSKSLIFAHINLNVDEYKLFRDLFDIMFQMVPKPDLLVYLYLPVARLQENIAKRGRQYEQNISAQYLDHIQLKYLDFLRKQATGIRVLILDVSKVDFVHVDASYQRMLQILDKPISKGVQHQVV